MPMTNAPWRGVFTLPVTPFHTDGSIAWARLRSVVGFGVGAGADGNWARALREAVRVNHVDAYAKECKM